MISSNRTLPVVVLTRNPNIDQRIAPILVAPQTLLTPVTKKVVTDAASCGAWVNRTLRRVRRTSVNGSTPGDMGHIVSIGYYPSLVLIEIVATFPPCGLRGSLQVGKKRKSTSIGLGGNIQKLDNDPDSASIFSKVIGNKIFNSSSDDLYLRCSMKFARDIIQTQAPQFMDLGLPAINTLYESGVLGTPTTKIQRPTDGSHWSAPDHVFGEATVAAMSAENSDHG